MSSIDRTGGLGGQKPIRPRQLPTSPLGGASGEHTPRVNKDQSNFSNATGRLHQFGASPLEEMLGKVGKALGNAPASNLVSASKGDTAKLIEDILQRTFGRRVNLGEHLPGLAAHVDRKLAEEGLSVKQQFEALE